MAAKTFGGLGEAAFWWIMAALSLAIAGYGAFLTATWFAPLGSPVADNAAAFPLGLPVHVIAAGIALILGPFQFHRGLRTRAPQVHRWMGRIYVLGCLVGGLAGGALALGTQTGPVASAGFLGLAVGWIGATAMAWRCARARDFVAHERWMVRSFALTLAAVTLRIQLPLALIATEGDFPLVYPIIAWTCWIPNLVLAETWLWTKRRSARAAA